MLEVKGEFGRQLAKLLSATVLSRSPPSKMRMDMVFIERGHHLAKCSTHITRASKRAIQERGLKPTVEIFNRAIILRLPWRDEDDLNPQSETHPNEATEQSRRSSKATKFAPIIKLDLLWNPSLLPGMYDKVDHGVHLPILGKFKEDRPVEHVLADQEIIPRRVTS
jgi:hypothetical protein